jgi:hypothetical protein
MFALGKVAYAAWHGVLVWWGNLLLESAFLAEASGGLWSALPGGQLGELRVLNGLKIF